MSRMMKSVELGRVSAAHARKIRSVEMEWLVIVCQLVTALGLLNVWLLRTGKRTPWRGGDAKNMGEEFAVYGLSNGFMKVVGFFKVTLAVCLIVGLWVHIVTRPAAIGVAALMLGAVAMHVKVKDPFQKSLPALTLLVMSLLVAIS